MFNIGVSIVFIKLYLSKIKHAPIHHKLKLNYYKLFNRINLKQPIKFLM